MRVPGTRVLIVSDTTLGVNWGGRAASLALQQCIASRFENVDILPGVFSTRPFPLNTMFPTSIASPLIARRHKNAMLNAYYRLENVFGMKADFVELDPVRSAKNILKCKNKEHIRDLYEKVAKADIVVVDGDGDLIFKTPPGRVPLFNLAVIELASQLGKNVQYVNSIFADCPANGRNESFHKYARKTISKCSRVTLRDPDSIRLARESAPELKVELVPDSLFLWFDSLQDAVPNLPANGDYVIPFLKERPESFGRIRFDEPYVCISGSSRAALFRKEAAESYTQLAVALKDSLGMNVYLTPTCEGDHFLYEVGVRASLPVIPAEVPIKMAGGIVAKAEVYVTGRYHPAIMASFGGTPCVFLGADSHKTTSLQELLEYENVHTYSALPTPEECGKICEEAAAKIKSGHELRTRIQGVAYQRSLETQKLGYLI